MSWHPHDSWQWQSIATNRNVRRISSPLLEEAVLGSMLVIGLLGNGGWIDGAYP